MINLINHVHCIISVSNFVNKFCISYVIPSKYGEKQVLNTCSSILECFHFGKGHETLSFVPPRKETDPKQFQ